MLQFLLTISDESDHGKIEHIFYTYQDYMMRYAISKFRFYGRTNFFYDAEDAVQNAFVKITKYIHDFDFSRDERDIKNYVLSIVSNEINNILRDDTNFFEFDEEFCAENEYNFIEMLEMKERYNEVVRAIEDLDERYSTTLFLIYVKEMSINQIAEMMGISTKTVYTRHSRGKQLLLESLEGAKSNG